MSLLLSRFDPVLLQFKFGVMQSKFGVRSAKPSKLNF